MKLSKDDHVDQIEPVKTKHGWLSDACKASVTFHQRGKVDLFVKIKPENGTEMGDYFESKSFDQVEVDFYAKVLADLLSFEEHGSMLEKIIPVFYAGDYCLDKDNRGFYLILQDISASGFEMRSQFNQEEIQNVMENIAIFHAISHAFLLKNPDYLEKQNFPSTFETFINDQDFVQMTERNIEKFVQDQPLDLKEKAENFKKNWIQVYKEKVTLYDSKFLAHGDFWLNNVMIDSNQKSKILDWQMVVPYHPILDVSMMICSSLSRSNLENWSEQLVKHYHANFLRTCQKLDVKDDQPLKNAEDFYQLFLKKGIVITFLIWISAYEDFICSKPDFKPRFDWVFEKCRQFSPDIFEK